MGPRTETENSKDTSSPATCDGHIVKVDESRLSLIAERVLGDPYRWPEIAELNGLVGGKPYCVGDCLKLPVTP